MSKFRHTFIATLLLTVSSPLVLGCDEAAVSDEADEADEVTLSADEIASLPNGKAIVLNFQDELTYHIDPSAGDVDRSKVMLLGDDGTAITLEQALRDAPELADVDPVLLDGAKMTISGANAASADRNELSFRDSCAVVIVTEKYILVVFFEC